MKDHLRGGTNTPVKQNDHMSKPGANGGAGKADGIVYGSTNTSVSQGPAKGKNLGHDKMQAQKKYGSNERNGILSTLDRNDTMPNPKNGKSC